MWIYEVNLTVDREITEEFVSWLEVHIAEMIELEHFLGARYFERDAACEGIETDELLLTVHYELAARESYACYLSQDAAKMREEGLQRFGGRFRATRRLLHERQRFEGKTHPHHPPSSSTSS